MLLEPALLSRLIFGRRFSQANPVLPDVWLHFNESSLFRADLLLTPVDGATAGDLYKGLRARLKHERNSASQLTYNESAVVAHLTFPQMIRAALSLTEWWTKEVWSESARFDAPQTSSQAEGDRIRTLNSRVSKLEEFTDDIIAELRIRRNELAGIWQRRPPPTRYNPSAELLWLIDIVGSLTSATANRGVLPDPDVVVPAFQDLVRGLEFTSLKPILDRVNMNRAAEHTIWESCKSIKADAARRTFDVRGKGIRWAVIDTGIDATHPAFRRRDKHDKPYPSWIGSDGNNQTRVVECYDFTRLRDMLNPEKKAGAPENYRAVSEISFTEQDRKRIQKIRSAIRDGRSLDWESIKEVIRIPPEAFESRVPQNPHGTHVAGILAGDWRCSEGFSDYGKADLLGVCPELEIIDIRVLDGFGRSDEFTVMAALQFVRHLNGRNKCHVHGVNLSLSLRNSHLNHACGRTPVCEECHRLISAGTVVVAAAGNEGYVSQTSGSVFTGSRESTITDPGNAQDVITVGATHRDLYTIFGVSYFSSRGPTSDGRLKPDLVAPGQSITSCIPGNEVMTMDGTSMAAPHVSGAAALLMERNRNLIGFPKEIKERLIETAQDLKREKYYQGYGLVDIYKALGG